MLIQWLKGDQLYLFPQNIFLFLKTHQLSHSYYTETAVLDTTNKKACIFLLWCLWRLLYLLHLSSECQRNGSGNLFSWHSFAAITTICFLFWEILRYFCLIQKRWEFSATLFITLPLLLLSSAVSMALSWPFTEKHCFRTGGLYEEGAVRCLFCCFIVCFFKIYMKYWLLKTFCQACIAFLYFFSLHNSKLSFTSGVNVH